jgi:hypothetical protein
MLPVAPIELAFSELTVLISFVRFLILESGGVGNGADYEACVAAVDADQGVAEADRDPAGDAGRQEKHPPFPAAGREPASAPASLPRPTLPR